MNVPDAANGQLSAQSDRLLSTAWPAQYYLVLVFSIYWYSVASRGDWLNQMPNRYLAFSMDLIYLVYLVYLVSISLYSRDSLLVTNPPPVWIMDYGLWIMDIYLI